MPDSTPFIIYPRLGNQADSRCRLQAPGGLLLSGGAGHVMGAYRWMQDQLVVGSGQPGGDIVVLRATPDDSYSAVVMKAAPFNSVQTICVPELAKP